jgi:tetratricopeptide (TPR) repeat protein
VLVSRSQLRKAILLASATLILSSCASDPQKAKAKYLAAGQKYMKSGRYGDAAIEFRNAIRLDSRSADGYYQLSLADLALHDWQGAYLALERSLELDPSNLNARLDRARLQMASGRFDKTEEEANAVLQQDPKNAGAYQLLSASLVSQQKYDQALAALSKLAEFLPNDANSYVRMADIEDGLRRFKDAEAHLKRAVSVDPKSKRATIELANFYRQQKRLPEAQETLRAGIQNIPDAPQLYIDWADMLSESGNFTDAQGVLDKLRTQMPNSPEAAIDIADYYARKNDNEKALVELRRGLLVSPANVEIEKRLEDRYLVSNQIAQAAALDSLLLSQLPKDSGVGVLHGRLLLAQGKKQDAIIALQDAVKTSPDSASAHTHLALAYWQNENLGQAISELQVARRLSPASTLVLRSLVQLSLAQNRPSEAQLYAQELVQASPSHADARLLLGSIYMREGQARQAEEQFLAAGKLAPNEASVHFNLGILSAKEKKWPQAEKEFESAMRLDPLSLMCVSAYADLMVARQQSSKAFARVEQFVNDNPNNARAHVVLGVLQFNSKNNAAAQTEFEKAIQLDPKYVQGYLKLGQVYQEQNQTDAAIGEYQKVLDLQPRSAPMLTFLGNLYLEKNDLETARKYYARTLEVDPDFAVANANLAWIDAQEGKDLDVALGMAQKAESIMPDAPSVTDVLAWVMYKRGNYSGAIPLLQECIKKSPDSAQYHYHLGLAYLGAGQKDSAKTQLQAALQINQLRSAEKEQAQQALAQSN